MSLALKTKNQVKMNFDKINSKLAKFKRLQDSLENSGEEEITPMEKQLLLSYLDDIKKIIKKSKVSDETDEFEEEELQQVVAAPAPVAQIEVPPQPTEPEPEVEEVKISSELAAIFESDAGDEISDKLSMQPIADMNKSMGINEKFFTVQELFGGDQKAFQATLKALNGFNNMDEAKTYLVSNAAQEFDWGSPAKIKKAANFVKLVARRYL